MVSPAAVYDYLGTETPSVVQVAAHLDAVTLAVHAYTRGNGFDPLNGEPGPDLAAVIVSAASRSVSNPTHTDGQTIGGVTERPGAFTGWTLPELAVLNGYRRRAA